MDSTTQMTETRLNELDSDEFWDVCKAINPDMTREQFDADWADFCDLKRQKALQ